MEEKTRKSLGQAGKGFSLLVGLLLVFQLACITVDMGVKIIPDGPDTGRIEFMVAYRLTEKYLEEARKANQELVADYVEAGETPPDESFFPESFDDFDEKPDLSGIPGDNFQMISETPTEMVATNSARYGPGEELEGFGLTTEIDENGWTHYFLETTLPEFGDEETLDGLDELRSQGLGPKPPVTPPETEPSEEGGGMFGLMGLLGEIGSEVEGQISLEAWYAERIFLATGMPEYNYTIQMPGQIQSHTIDNQTGGTVEEDGATYTLSINEDYLRTFGPGEHTLRIESTAHPCAMECASSPHWVWDEMSEANNCGCICEQGWQPDESGNCVSCDDYCSGLDPRAVGDPAESYPNSCACRCDADLMKWEDGKCVCTVGAEPDGDGCSCKEGWELSDDGAFCNPSPDAPSEGPPTPVWCEPDDGMNCANSPQSCKCESGRICDIFSKYKDILGCAKPIAVYMVSPELTTYEQWWLSIKMLHIRRFLKSKGYQVEIVTMKTGDEATEALANPSTRAMAYFGHGAYPSIEHASSDKLKNAIHMNLVKRYRQAGMNKDQANQLATERSGQLNLDYAYMHTCYSLSDTTMRDYMVKPGGTYWGKEELLSAVAGLKESVRPAQ